MIMDQYCEDQIYSEDYFDLIIESNRYLDIPKTFPGSCYLIPSTTHVVVYVPVNTLPRNLIQNYGYAVIPKCYGLLDTASLEASGVTRVQEFPTLNLRGQGILIGIIDTGIDYRNNVFRYEDGTSKIISIWDQTIRSETAINEDIYYGTEYTQEQINLALASSDPLSVVPSMDENGHGTFLSGIIAGSNNIQNNFAGVVPDANLIVVKLKPSKTNLKDFFIIPPETICYQENDIITALNYLGEVSRKLMKPISICIGLGTSQGAHDGRDALSNIINRLGDYPGVAITVAAGNEGARRLHYFGIIDSTSGGDLVELKVGANEYGFSMELWGNTPNTYAIDILSPSGEYIPRIPARLGETREIRFLFEQTIIVVDYQLVEAETGDELILLRFRNPSEGIWRFRIYASGTQISDFHIWLPMHEFISSETYFTQPNPDTTITAPGNTIVPIVVTAYNTSNQSLFLNASRGFTRNNNVNLDLAAPGVNVIGPTLNNEFTTVSGTSVAAAHTAGIAAMLLEWGILRGNNVYMDSQSIKSLLIRGATRSPSQIYPNRQWGYGIVNVYNTFLGLRGSS